MSKVEHYRTQATFCRKLAADTPGSRHVARWLSLADNYDRMALSENRYLGERVQRLLKNAGLTDEQKLKSEPNDSAPGSL